MEKTASIIKTLSVMPLVMSSPTMIGVIALPIKRPVDMKAKIVPDVPGGMAARTIISRAGLTSPCLITVDQSFSGANSAL